MLSKEVEEMIKNDALRYVYSYVTIGGDNLSRQLAYEKGATRMAELMIEFAEWCENKHIRMADGNWSESVDGGNTFTTSDLLTMFFNQHKMKER